MHACEGDAVTKLTNEKVPYFNAPIYLQNKTQIGKVDEIFGPINESVSASFPSSSVQYLQSFDQLVHLLLGRIFCSVEASSLPLQI